MQSTVRAVVTALVGVFVGLLLNLTANSITPEHAPIIIPWAWFILLVGFTLYVCRLPEAKRAIAGVSGLLSVRFGRTAKLISVSAGLVTLALEGGFVYFIFQSVIPFPVKGVAFPWIRPSKVQTSDSLGFYLYLEVHSYPPKSIPRPALSHVHVLIAVPVAVHPRKSGWWSCNIADFDADEWNEDDSSRKPIGPVRMLTGKVPVEFE
jgi:hypothetical protein